ncbi:MAG: MFS transporter [Bryobacteraceae bacterium]|jgi:MFS family permease
MTTAVATVTRPNPWPGCRTLPSGPAAALAALHLAEPELGAVRLLTDRDWRRTLEYCDRSHLTLTLHRAARDAMPGWVRERTDRNAAQNQQRLRLTEEAYRLAARRLNASRIGFLALKGITHCALFGTPAAERVQYDLDLFSPPESVHAAEAALRDLGYERIPRMEDLPTDHLPTLIRKTGWEWRGDFFDVDIPLSVELHFRFWNGTVERLPAPDTEEFWSRRTRLRVADKELDVLCLPDALAYAGLHFLRHVLRGDTIAFHAYEIARFLDARAEDDQFWNEWSALHSPLLRRLETVAFRLAAEWFGCRMAPALEREMAALPSATEQWFTDLATAPVASEFNSNKEELWLHVSLIEARRDKWSVARRRLLPGNLPRDAGAIHVPASELTWRKRARYKLRHLAYITRRSRRHTVSLAGTVVSVARWWRRANGLTSQFWAFLATAIQFNFGLFIFFLLYNLHLFDLGYREDFLGVVGSTATIGSIVGTIPAAFLTRRFGLRRVLLADIACTAAIVMLRSVATSRLPLVALAFGAGALFSVWAVVISPAIAGAVEEKHRPLAFSVFFAVMFAVGIAGNYIGGCLPAWLHGKQPALLLAAFLVALALLPAWYLKVSGPPPERAKVYPRSRFLFRYLAAFAVWNLATGSFNPFHNVYFAHLRFSAQRIGTVFSGSQVVQLAGVLMAPAIFRKAGLVTGIVWMMAATAIGLARLSTQPTATTAVLAYAWYMAFQWMSEPGLNALLMSRVAERERSGASALNYLVAFSAQAIAALAAGRLLAHFGYGVVLAGAAVIAAGAAGLFQAFVNSRAAEPRTAHSIAASTS